MDLHDRPTDGDALPRVPRPPDDDAPLRRVTRPVPLAKRAYDAIREAVLTGADLAADRLTEDDLARSLSMSRTPVREALQRLALAGLIEPSPGGGYARRRTTPRDVREQCELRLLLEPPAARLAAAAPPESREPLAAELAGALEADGAVGELRFHVAIADASGSGALAGLIRPLNERAAVHRAQQPGDAQAERRLRAGRKAVAAAIERGDGAAAEQAMREHLEVVRAVVGPASARPAGEPPSRRTAAGPASRRAVSNPASPGASR
jgi:DNA-binding GntR family transcriptional regulator